MSAKVITSPSNWLTYYQQLITSIVGMGVQYQNAVMVDILNEPDSQGLKCAPPLLCSPNPFLLYASPGLGGILQRM
jgi:hypothetical protein